MAAHTVNRHPRGSRSSRAECKNPLSTAVGRPRPVELGAVKTVALGAAGAHTLNARTLFINDCRAPPTLSNLEPSAAGAHKMNGKSPQICQNCSPRGSRGSHAECKNPFFINDCRAPPTLSNLEPSAAGAHKMNGKGPQIWWSLPAGAAQRWSFSSPESPRSMRKVPIQSSSSCEDEVILKLRRC